MAFSPRRRHAVYVCALTLVALPYTAAGQTRASLSDLRESLRVTQDLQDDLRALRDDVRVARTPASAPFALSVLLAAIDRVRADLLLASSGSERLQDALRTASLPAVVMQRQQQASTALAEESARLLARLDALTAAASTPIDAVRLRTALDALAEQLDRSSTSDDRTPLGVTLPVRSLTLPATEPQVGAAIVPAYANNVVLPPAIADLAVSAEASGDGSGDQAQALHQSAIEIYEFVRNSITTEFYYGAMKGADAMLRDRGGNDIDQASLLIAMMRQSGIPARYVRGVISLNAQEAFAWTGLTSTRRVTELLTRAGIPFRAIAQGGAIARFEVEHTWTEVLVPYANYRGVLLDVSGRAWIPLDPSFKPIVTTAAADIPAIPGLKADTIATSYLSALQSLSPLDFFRRAVTDALTPSGLSLPQVLRLRSVEPATAGLLPSTLPYATASVNQEFAEVPDVLRHRIRFVATASAGASFDITLPAAEVLGRRLTLSYIPATVEDQIAADAFLGLDNTPAYLVQVRPVLKVGGVVRAAGALPQQMGALHEFRMDVVSPRQTIAITNSVVAGGYFAIAFAGGSLRYVPAETPAPDDTERPAADLLFRQAADFLAQWRDAEDRFAELLHVVPVHPVPAEVMVGNAYHRTVVFGQPQSIDWRGIQVDADLNVIEPIPVGIDDATRAEFTRLVGLSGSTLEGDVLQHNLGVDSVSAAKLLQLAHAAGIPVEEVDSSNLTAKLPLLDIPAAVRSDVTDAVNQRWRVTIPRRDLTHNIWTGTGYIARDPATGAAGYFISGGLAGGMTSEDPDDWVQQQYVDQFGHPYQDEPNMDASAAANIRIVAVTDKQTGTVGRALPRALAVAVRDGAGRPVQGASVTFAVLVGGGSFAGATTVSAPTDYLGVARVAFTLGTRTHDLPFYVKTNPSDQFATQVGQNIVTATVDQNPAVVLQAPFQLFGSPDAPHHLTKVLGGGSAWPGSAGGSVLVRLEDRHDNPIANADVMFAVQVPNPQVPNASNLVIYPHEPPCAVRTPVIGDCNGVAQLTTKTSIFGASVETIMGNTPGTTFAVAASVPASPDAGSQAFTFQTVGTLGDAYHTPQVQLSLVNLINDRMQQVNATRAGTQLGRPLEAVLAVHEDDYAIVPIEAPCPLPSDPCYRVVSRKTTKLRLVDVPHSGFAPLVFPGRTEALSVVVNRNVEEATLTFTPVSGGGTTTPPQPASPGRFASVLTVGASPAMNEVRVNATASIWVPCFDLHQGLVVPKLVMLRAGEAVSPASITSCAAAGSAPVGNNQTETQSHFVFGVEGVVTEHTVEVNENGETRATTEVNYSIQPAAYGATTADVDLFEAPMSGGSDRWTGLLPGNRLSGSGSATLLAGVFLDPSLTHRTQLVVNRGTEAEVRSQKASLIIRQPQTSELAAQSARVVTRIDRINRDMCTDVSQLGVWRADGAFIPLPGEAVITPGAGLVFKLSEDARVTITIDGNLLRVATPDGPRTYQDVASPAGINDVLLPPESIASTGQHVVEITAKFARGGQPDEVVIVQAAIVHDVVLEAYLAVGHTLVKGVDVQDGHFSVSRQDLTIRGIGPALEFSRGYGSGGRSDSGPMGAGWTHNYESRIVKDSCGRVTVVGGEGSGVRFFSPRDGVDDQGNPVTVFAAQAGYHATLMYRTGDDSYDFYTKDKIRYHYERGLAQSAGSAATVVHRLGYIEDTHHNRLSLSYSTEPPFNLMKVTDASGRSLTFTYRPFGRIPADRLVAVSGPLGLLVTYEYDEVGNLKTVTRDTKIERYEYTATTDRDPHNLVRIVGPNHGITGPDSDVTAVAYYADSDPFPGQAANNSIGSDPLIFPEKYEFVKSVTEGAGTPAAATSTFVYDYSQVSVRITTTVTDPLGVPTQYILHPSFGAVTEKRIVTSAGENVTRTRWAFEDGINDVYITQVTDPNGRVTSYQYDANGNVLRETIATSAIGYAPVTTAQGAAVDAVTTSYEYEPTFNKATKKTDPEGNVTLYEIAPVTGDLLSTTTNANDGSTPIITRYTYADTPRLKGLLATVTNPRGGVTTYQNFDSFGNPQSVTDPGGNVATNAYDARNRLVATSDGLGHRTTYTYDSLDRLVGSQRDAWNQPADLTMASADRTVTSTYFPGGQKRTSTNGLQHTTVYSYDPVNRIAGEHDEVMDADGNVSVLEVLTTYDRNGNPVVQRDRNGVEHQTTYDGLNRVTQIRVNAQTVSAYTYDQAGNRLTETDLHGHRTTFEYDGLYRVVRSHLPLEPYVITTMFDRAGNIVATTDANGHISRRTYDGVYRLTSVTDAVGRTVLYSYDAAGNKTREQNTTTGLVTRYENYDPLNRARTIVRQFTDPLTGSSVEDETRRSYVDAQHVVETTDALGRRMREVFNGHDVLVEQTLDVGGLNLVTTYQYDGNGNLIGAKDAEGSNIDLAVVYDGLNRKIRTVYALGGEQRTYYDGNGNVVRVVDKRGIVTRYEYDHLNRKSRDILEESISNGGASLVASRLIFDDQANSVTAVDANGGSSTTTYDALHREVRRTDALGQSETTEWDGTRKRATVDKRGIRTEMRYDDADRIVETRRVSNGASSVITTSYQDSRARRVDTDPAGVDTVTQFDAVGRIRQVSKRHSTLAPLYGSDEVVLETRTYDAVDNNTTIIDGDRNITRFEYDGVNRRTARHDADGSSVAATTSYTYDRAGNLLTIKDGRPHARAFDQRFTYDARSRKTQEENAAGEIVRYTYDQSDNVQTVTDARGGVTAYAYGELDELLSVDETRGGVGGITLYRYDANRNRVAQQDASGSLTTFRYDALNRQTDSFQHTVAGLVSPGGARTSSAGGDEASARHWRFQFDGNDNQTLVVDAEGQTVTKAYDYLNRLISKEYAGHKRANDGTDVFPKLMKVATQYDANGNVTRIDETKYLDAQTLIVEPSVMEYDALNRQVARTNYDGKRITYAYDAHGNRTAVTDADDRVTSYTFDGWNRIATVRTAPAGVTTYTYWPDGLVRSTAYPNGTIAEWTYDDADRVVRIVNHHGDASAPISQYDYGYDRNGNRTQQTERHSGLLAGAPQQTTFVFDVLNRLTGVTYGDGGSVRYTYAPNGNRLSETGTDPASEAAIDRTYGYNRLNELTTIVDRATPDASAMFDYDANGNTLSERLGSFDSSGTITAPVQVRAYAYDIRDNLARATIPGGSQMTFDYDYSGRRIKALGPFAHIRYLYDQGEVLQEYDGGTKATTLKYAYTNSLLSLETVNPSSRTDFFYLIDGLNSVSELTDQAGGVQASYMYDAWGGIKDSVNLTPNRRTFTGHYQDTETGLGYFGARYYDASIGRFLTQDAFLGDIREPITTHRYLYANDNPTTFIDPTGYFSEPPELKRTCYEGGFTRCTSLSLRMFGRGVGKAIGTFVYETLATTYDIEQVALATGRTLVNGRPFDVKFTSAIGQNALQRHGQPQQLGFLGKTTEEVLDALNLQANSAVKAPLEFPAAIIEGNPEAIGAATPGAMLTVAAIAEPFMAGETTILERGSSPVRPLANSVERVGGALDALPSAVEFESAFARLTEGPRAQPTSTFGKLLPTEAEFESLWGRMTEAPRPPTAPTISPAELLMEADRNFASRSFNQPAALDPAKPWRSARDLGAEQRLIKSLPTVNDTAQLGPGNHFNCVNVCQAGDLVLGGKRAVADPSAPKSVRVLETHFNAKFRPYATQAEVEAALVKAGPGARGIVRGVRKEGIGHVFNALTRVDGTPMFPDFQAQRPATFNGFERFELLITTK